LQALTDGRWKTIRAGAASEVYDLQNDPQEAHDIASSQPNGVTAMSTRIGAIRAAGGVQGSRTLSPEAEQYEAAWGPETPRVWGWRSILETTPAGRRLRRFMAP
jgi:hypothetical protein